MSPLKHSLHEVPGSFVQLFSLCKGVLPAAKELCNAHSHPPKFGAYFLCVCILGVSPVAQPVTSSDSRVSVGSELQVLKGVSYDT